MSSCTWPTNPGRVQDAPSWPGHNGQERGTTDAPKVQQGRRAPGIQAHVCPRQLSPFLTCFGSVFSSCTTETAKLPLMVGLGVSCSWSVVWPGLRLEAWRAFFLRGDSGAGVLLMGLTGCGLQETRGIIRLPAWMEG